MVDIFMYEASCMKHPEIPDGVSMTYIEEEGDVMIFECPICGHIARVPYEKIKQLLETKI